MRLRVLFASLALIAPAGPALAAGPAPTGTAGTAGTASALPPIRHVFQITLENKSYDETFGPGSPAGYLNGTLVPQGQLLTQYYGTGHNSLDNYISMVSGQAPNMVTQADCPFYTDVSPGTPTADGQVIGQGCVYPAAVQTLAGQLQDVGLSWRGYMEDMGNTLGREEPYCGRPITNILGQDPTQSATAQDQYAARHNPFVYFHAIVDDEASCRAHVVPLSLLPDDLALAGTTAEWNFITPDLCHDGHDATCADPAEPGGLVGEDTFLKTWVPKIMASPAYQDGGLIIIGYDESETGSDAAACCNEPTGPNTPSPGINGPGGGRTGMLLLSPYITPGSTNATPYNHYSLLRSLEDIFGVGHLGYAAQDGLRAFGSDVFPATAAAADVTPAAAVAPVAHVAPSAAPDVAGRLLAATGAPPLAGLAAALLAGAALLRRRTARR